MIQTTAELIREIAKPRTSHSGLRPLQKKRLRTLVRHTYEQVPFYRERFGEAHVRPEEIRRIEDLLRIPLCERKDICEAGLSKILARDVDPGDCRKILTSGSCREPLPV